MRKLKQGCKILVIVELLNKITIISYNKGTTVSGMRDTGQTSS